MARRRFPSGVRECFIAAASDETTALTTGTAKLTFQMPYAFTLSEAIATLTTASSSGAVTVDINKGGVSILASAISIAQGATSGTGSISTKTLAKGDVMTVDIDGAGTGAAGLKIELIGTQG